jgi:hypothetical protein
MSRLVLFWSALLLIAYQAQGGLPSDAADVLPYLMSFVVVVVAVTAIVTLVVTAVRRGRTAVRPHSNAPVPKLVG